MNYYKIFGDLSTIKKFKKKEIILEKSVVENYLSFIIKGSITIVTYHNGNEICISFGIEDSFFSSYGSFLTRAPSEYQVLALEDTIIERIDFESLQKAYSISGDHQKNGRKIAEQLYIKANKRILTLISKTAEERYVEFIEEYPGFLQRIPLKYLASYLGITPVSLSRIRNKITKI
jgi:CRP-like cAMP-binding protein